MSEEITIQIVEEPVQIISVAEQGPPGPSGHDSNPVFTIPALFDGFSTGDSAVVAIDFPMTILGWQIFAADICTAHFAIAKSSSLTVPVFQSITGATAPEIVDAAYSVATNIDDWSVILGPGDVLKITLLDVTSPLAWISLNIKSTRNPEV